MLLYIKTMKLSRRNYMCTIQVSEKDKETPEAAIPDMLKYAGIKRITMQLEEAPTTKKLHWQTFLEFEYPKLHKSLVDENKKQGKSMHIDTKSTGHVKAGRSYCSKGEAINQKRFVWIKDIGWEPSDPYIIEERIDMSTKEGLRRQLKKNIQSCRDYIMKSVVQDTL